MVLWLYTHQVIYIKYEQLFNMLITPQWNSFWKLSFFIFRLTQATPRFSCSEKHVFLHLSKAKHCICALGPSPPSLSKFHQFFSSASRFPSMSPPRPSAEVAVLLQHQSIWDSPSIAHTTPQSELTQAPLHPAFSLKALDSSKTWLKTSSSSWRCPWSSQALLWHAVF